MQVIIFLSLLLIACARASYNATLVYTWVTVDYDWPNATMKRDYQKSDRHIVENNIVAGIKVYKNEVYLTVPRWRRGIPSTLNRVVMKDGRPLLQPYPSWSYQTVGDCSALQYVQSMEIDPNTGRMWILDTGRVEFLDTTPARNLCPPKLVIYDIGKKEQVHSYTFPDDVANHSSCFLDDVVLDYVNGDVQFAYITDTLEGKLYVYDYRRDTSYVFQDPSMMAEKEGGFPIDGIAMSAQFDFVYFCPLDGLGLFQIPTSVLRDPEAQFNRHVRRCGTRRSRSGGIAYGQDSLLYSMLDHNGVQRWLLSKDAEVSGYDNVTMTTQEEVVRDDVRMRWVDTLAWDESGYLWFTANDLSKFLDGTKDFSGSSGPNVYVWKVFVNESYYLANAETRTRGQSASLAPSLHRAGPGTALTLLPAFVCVCVCVLSGLVLNLN